MLQLSGEPLNYYKILIFFLKLFFSETNFLRNIADYVSPKDVIFINKPQLFHSISRNSAKASLSACSLHSSDKVLFSLRSREGSNRCEIRRTRKKSEYLFTYFISHVLSQRKVISGGCKFIQLFWAWSPAPYRVLEAQQWCFLSTMPGVISENYWVLRERKRKRKCVRVQERKRKREKRKRKRKKRWEKKRGIILDWNNNTSPNRSECLFIYEHRRSMM